MPHHKINPYRGLLTCPTSPYLRVLPNGDVTPHQLLLLVSITMEVGLGTHKLPLDLAVNPLLLFGLLGELSFNSGNMLFGDWFRYMMASLGFVYCRLGFRGHDCLLFNRQETYGIFLHVTSRVTRN